MQVKLLRALEERQIRRAGDTTLRRIDVRILAATHCDLDEEVAQQRFRADFVLPPSCHRRAHPAVAGTARGCAEPSLRLPREHRRAAAPPGTDVRPRDLGPNPHLPLARQHSGARPRHRTRLHRGAGRQIEMEDLPRQMRQAFTPPLGSMVVRPLRLVERECADAALA